MLKFVLACAVALLSLPALAQTPAGPPSYGAPITVEQAKKAAAGAIAEAKKNNWQMAVSIVEPTGDLAYFEKVDGTQYASIKISEGKARTAVRYRRPTKAFFDAMESGHPYVATLDTTLVASEGGELIIVDGRIIGAIGVSGGTGAQDGQVARAGVATFGK
jgi:uncharacterized protein GlcG (DUF336 family)